MCLSTRRYGLIGMSPRRRRTLHRRGLQKLALNSGRTRKSAKNAEKPSKSPPPPSWPPYGEFVDELRQQNIDHPVQMYCNCGTFAGFWMSEPFGNCRCTTTGMSNAVQERHLESLSGQLHSLHCGYTSLEHNRKVHHSVDELIRSMSMKRNCWNMSLRGHRDIETEELHRNAARPAPPRPSPCGLRPTSCARSSARVAATSGAGSPCPPRCGAVRVASNESHRHPHGF